MVSARYQYGHDPVAFSPDNRKLAFTSTDDNGYNTIIHVQDLIDPQSEPLDFAGHASVISSAAFSPDSKSLATGSWDRDVRFWDLTDPEGEHKVLTGHEGWVGSVAFSPDGRILASSGNNGAILLWDLLDLEAEPLRLEGFADDLKSLAFSPDGQTLASGNLIYNQENTIQLWDLDDLNAEPVTLVERDRDAFLQSVAFSPDGRTLASSNNHGIIRLWDLNAPEAEPVSLIGHKGVVSTVTFSPDGRTLASGGKDGTVRLWTLPDELVELGCQKVGRYLTWLEWQQFLAGEPYHETCPDLPDLPQDYHVDFLIGEGEHLVLNGEIPAAIAKFEEALAYGATTVFMPQTKVNEIIAGRLGIELGEGEDLEQAIRSLIEIHDPGDKSAPEWNQLCWVGSLYGYAAQVMVACERAVALDPEHGNYRDSRGLARALTGDYEGAIEDFRFFVEWAKRENLSLNVDWREVWIIALTEAKNPFDEETKKQLLIE